MLRTFVLFVAVIILSICTVSAGAQSFTFTITPVKDTVKVGSEIRIKLQLKNTSEDDINMMSVPCGKGHCPEIEGFRPIVKDFRGSEPPLSEWGRKVYGRTLRGESDLVLNAVGMYPLEPGQIYTADLIVTNLFDMSEPGAYTIRIPYCATPYGVPLDRGKKRESQYAEPVVTVKVIQKLFAVER